MSQPAQISTSGPVFSAAGHDVSPLSEDEVTDLAQALTARREMR